jgi:hypothetical protein
MKFEYKFDPREGLMIVTPVRETVIAAVKAAIAHTEQNPWKRIPQYEEKWLKWAQCFLDDTSRSWAEADERRKYSENDITRYAASAVYSLLRCQDQCTTATQEQYLMTAYEKALLVLEYTGVTHE